MNVTATDKDIGYNAIIHYTIIGETSFYVGELSGAITTLQPLDYESRAQYTVILKAFNPGEPNLQDTANITGISSLLQKSKQANKNKRKKIISLRDYFSIRNCKA